MKRQLARIALTLPLFFSEGALSREVESSLEARVDEPLVLADSGMLNDLVGGPDEGSILEKLRGLFFRCNGDISLRITREALEDYFSKATNEDAISTSGQILEGFLYADVNSRVGGGIFVAMQDTTAFSVKYGRLDLGCEISPDYDSEIIGKFSFDSGDSCVASYASRINVGYSDMEINDWLVSVLDFFGWDRAEAPEFREAHSFLSLGGGYYAIFDSEGERIGKIFDNKNNKYEREDLDEDYSEAYEDCVKCIKSR